MSRVLRMTLALAIAAVLAGEVLIWRELRALDRRVELLDPPSDLVDREIEELRARLATLERKAAREARAKGGAKAAKGAKSITE